MPGHGRNVNSGHLSASAPFAGKLTVAENLVLGRATSGEEADVSTCNRKTSCATWPMISAYHDGKAQNGSEFLGSTRLLSTGSTGSSTGAADASGPSESDATGASGSAATGSASTGNNHSLMGIICVLYRFPSRLPSFLCVCACVVHGNTS